MSHWFGKGRHEWEAQGPGRAPESFTINRPRCTKHCVCFCLPHMKGAQRPGPGLGHFGFFWVPSTTWCWAGTDECAGVSGDEHPGMNESVLSFDLLTQTLGLPHLLVPHTPALRDILVLPQTDQALTLHTLVHAVSLPGMPSPMPQLRFSMVSSHWKFLLLSWSLPPCPSFWPSLALTLCLLEIWDDAEALGARASPSMGQAQKWACGWLRDSHPALTWETPGRPTPSLLLCSEPAGALVSIQGLHVSGVGLLPPGCSCFLKQVSPRGGTGTLLVALGMLCSPAKPLSCVEGHPSFTHDKPLLSTVYLCARSLGDREGPQEVQAPPLLASII